MTYVLIVAIGIALPIFGAGSAAVPADRDPLTEFRDECALLDADVKTIDKNLKRIFTKIKQVTHATPPLDYIKSNLSFLYHSSDVYAQSYHIILLLSFLDHQRLLALQGLVLLNRQMQLRTIASEIQSLGNDFIQELCLSKTGIFKFHMSDAVQYDYLHSLIGRYDGTSGGAGGVFDSKALLQDIGRLRVSTLAAKKQMGLLLTTVYEAYVFTNLRAEYLSKIFEKNAPKNALTLYEGWYKAWGVDLSKIKELGGMALFAESGELMQKQQEDYKLTVATIVSTMVYHWYNDNYAECQTLYTELYNKAVEFFKQNRNHEDIKGFFRTTGKAIRPISVMFNNELGLLPEPQVFALPLRDTPQYKNYSIELDRQSKEAIARSIQEATKKKQEHDAREARRKKKEEAARVSAQQEAVAAETPSVATRLAEPAEKRIPVPVPPVDYWEARDGAFIRGVRIDEEEDAIGCRYMCVLPENTARGWPPRAYNCECMIYRWYEDEENRPRVALPITYAASIGRWFVEPENAVQSYLSKLSSRGQNEAIAARIMLSHMLPHVLDQYINRYASYDLWEDRDRRYTVLSKLTIRAENDGSIINDSYGVISWTFNARNECYHRSFSIKIPEIAEQGAVAAQYAAEFPVLPSRTTRPAQ